MINLFLSLMIAYSASLPLDQYKGKIVYVDFWASWCSPCALSFPWMQEIEKRYKNKDFVLITVNVDEEKSDALKFLKRLKAESFHVIYDPEAKLAEKYDVESMPTSLIFDKKGKLLAKHSGFTLEKAKEYEKELEKLLKP